MFDSHDIENDSEFLETLALGIGVLVGAINERRYNRD